MQAKRKDFPTWLCAAWRAQEQTLTGQKHPIPTSPRRTQERRHTEQQPGASPAPGGALMVLLTLAGETGVAVGLWGCGAEDKGRGEACSYFAFCAANSGGQAAGVSCTSVRCAGPAKHWIPASSL